MWSDSHQKHTGDWQKDSSTTKAVKRYPHGSSHGGTAERNPTRNHEVVGLIPGLAQWVKDLVLLWLWFRPVATALIRPLAWEPPYAAGAALEKAKRQQQQKFPF